MKYNFVLKNNIVEMLPVIDSSVTSTMTGSNIDKEVTKSALGGYFKRVTLRTNKEFKPLTLESFLARYRNSILNSINKNSDNKVILSIVATMRNAEEVKKYFFNSKPVIIYRWNNKDKIVSNLFKYILSEFYKKSFEGSGWSFLNFDKVVLNYGKYIPFIGGCGNINNLPNWIKNKKATVFFITTDDKCFYWSIIRHFIPINKNKGLITKDMKQLSSNKFADFTDIKFPTSSEDLSKFQKQNSNIHLVIFGVDERSKRTPVIFDENTTGEKINLLYYENHYYYITDLSRLLSSQLSKSNGKVYFCYKCQLSSHNESKIKTHEEVCGNRTLLDLPLEGKNYLSFQEKNNEPCITVYFDFESILLKYDDIEGKKENRHIPSIYSFYIISSNEDIYKSKRKSFVMTDDTQNIAKIFAIELLSEIRRAIEVFKSSSVMTPVLCHNSSGYDTHLFILEIARLEGFLSIIPTSEEKYISFSKFIFISGKRHEVRFLDSYKFLSSSLDTLVNETKKIKENFIHTVKGFPNIDLELLTRKGIFPYSYMNSIDRFKETSLPKKEEFYNDLRKENITNEEYEHALKIWNVLNCKTLAEYAELYCILDVLLLADMIENFKKLNISCYGINPLVYGYTLPGASWHNMLLYTKQKIELLTDQEVYEDFEKGIRGGVSMCVKRYARANNKYLTNYDPSKKSNFILYIDKNNLYGEAMSENIPFAIERKLLREEFHRWREFSCALVCDLEIPFDKKEYLRDFPPAPEHIKINGVEKLIPNLTNKKEYLVHSRLLKYYEKLGIIVTKIHRGYIFKESKWLEPFITYNTKQRSISEEESKQKYFKLSINSIYGKTIENPRKRSNVEICNNEERARKLLKSPEYISFKIFNESLVSVTKKKTVVRANKPIYIGFSVLEISKLKMFELYYDYLIPKFGHRLQLLYTDTDSFILDIESEDIYKELLSDIDICFDTWKYPKNHELYSTKNKNRLGFFKDETKGNPIKEFISTCSKSYAIIVEEDNKKEKEILKLKGIVDSCIKNKDITFEDYRKCLFEDKEKKVSYKGFKTKNHEIYTENFVKIALSPLQDVRIVLEDKIMTVPIGYYSKE